MNSRTVRYVLVGIYNTAVGYLIFYLVNLLLGRQLHYLAILVISYLISVTHAYIGQRYVVFHSSAKWAGEYLRFFMVNLSGLGGNMLLLSCFVELGIPVMAAQAISVLIITALSYFGHRYFSFKTYEPK